MVATTSGAFSEIAENYDHEFGSNPVGARQRKKVHEIFDEYFKPPGPLWDIGCGTGLDALEMVRKGFKVTVTDVSVGMLKELHAKAGEENLLSELTIIPGSVDSFFPMVFSRPRSFSGIYSNFGAINCFSSFDLFRQTVSRVLKPGEYMILVFMGRFSPVETLYFFSRGKIREGCRRFSKGPVTAAVGENKIEIRYYSVRFLQKIFESSFDLVKTIPLGLCLPPHYTVNPESFAHRLLPLFDRMENSFSRMPLFSRSGDHVLAVFRKKDEPGDKGKVP